MTPRSCSIDGCEREPYARGWCGLHYKRARARENENSGRLCILEGCDRPLLARGWCDVHYQRARTNGGDPGPGGLRPPIDHASFVVPTAQVWYWIGMLGADGCVSDEGAIFLRLQERDSAHVEALRAFVGGGHEGRISGPSKSDRSYCLAFTSRPIAADLLRLGGITPRKSLTYDPGTQAAAEAAFWLGMLDGDGTTGIYTFKRANAVRPQLRWLGTKAAIARCAEFWTDALPDRHIGKIVPARKLWQFGVQGETAQRAAVLLLDSCDFSLARKRETIERIAAFVNWPMSRRGRTCSVADCDAANYGNGLCSKHYQASRPPCTIEGCDSPQFANGWCSKHYKRARRNGGDPGPPGPLRPPRDGCVIEGCERPHVALGWCGMHYKRVVVHGDPGAVDPLVCTGCTVDGCDQPHASRGWCQLHYMRARANGGDPGPVGPLVRVAPARCTLADCDREHLARGMCARHYYRDRDRRHRAIAAGAQPEADRRYGQRLPRVAPF